jgi:hypothetical protein
MRAVDIVLITLSVLIITLSVLIITLIGLAPPFPTEPPAKRIEQECRLFYGPSSDAAVEACNRHMSRYAERPN